MLIKYIIKVLKNKWLLLKQLKLSLFEDYGAMA